MGASQMIGVFLVSLACFTTAEYCKLDAKDCTCINENGWGVDLRNISGKSISSYPSGPHESYLLSLCKDAHDVPEFVNGINQCKDGYSVCKISSTTENGTTTYTANYQIRDQQWPPLTKDNTSSALLIQIPNLYTIHLVCVKDESDTNFVNRSEHLYLYSPAVCLSLLRPPPPAAEGLGTGAVLSILILVFLFSYCSLGIVYNHFVRGTRGVEIIPNIEFWRSLPGLCMDGVRFIQNGCRPPGGNMSGSGSRETYDSI